MCDRFHTTAAVSAVLGLWSGLPSAYTYQWRRCNTAGGGCTDIAGATSAALTPATADIGSTLRVIVVAADGVGVGTAVVSGPSAAVVTDDEAPTAAYAPSTYTPVIGQAVSFDASASSDPDGTITGYRWTWGDGTPDGSGPNPTHAFASAGVHSVGLYVTDSSGLTAAVGHGITLSDESPTAGFTPSTYTPHVGQTVTFTGTARDPDGTISSYRWVWGDGTPDGSGPTATHAFATAGRRTVALHVLDSDGGSAVAGHSITAS